MTIEEINNVGATAEEISKKLKKAFSKVKIHECTMCGRYLTDEEFKSGEGVCLKHWDN